MANGKSLQEKRYMEGGKVNVASQNRFLKHCDPDPDLECLKEAC